MPRVKIHYAIKANPHPEILRVMADMGSCFDVASDGEIRTLHDMGVDGGRLIYANPVLQPPQTAHAQYPAHADRDQR